MTTVSRDQRYVVRDGEEYDVTIEGGNSEFLLITVRCLVTGRQATLSYSFAGRVMLSRSRKPEEHHALDLVPRTDWDNSYRDSLITPLPQVGHLLRFRSDLGILALVTKIGDKLTDPIGVKLMDEHTGLYRGHRMYRFDGGLIDSSKAHNDYDLVQAYAPYGTWTHGDPLYVLAARYGNGEEVWRMARYRGLEEGGAICATAKPLPGEWMEDHGEDRIPRYSAFTQVRMVTYKDLAELENKGWSLDQVREIRQKVARMNCSWPYRYRDTNPVIDDRLSLT